ncbi:cytochrome c oxidase assembly protein [Pyronema domesticum]|uniref:Similar to Cytochrome c oxidase assembly protein COX11, mitochondrial acc. no. P19516 n=1 Tax=Pyronema omphalodes (strain CBS 100304) TaxID=1076935 RepID=U4KZQ6_PYROM|nr:cytochrome c oxidase assembly protein [Pyronema domesticum]CCX05189.1 Similar to Cytochrome c oxidase assembly protein COX11, mitochondrial; acc. no. P19516 [Pyronema omphalodes CBS 100304]
MANSGRVLPSLLKTQWRNVATKWNGSTGRQANGAFRNVKQQQQFFSSTPLRTAQQLRQAPNYRAQYHKKNADIGYYMLSVTIATLTLSYASVPLYRAICQRTGYGGVPITDQTRFTPDKLVPVQGAKRIRVTFASSVSDVLDWKFTPQQKEVRVLPGETALAFYTATNKSKDDIIGVATYSVSPGQVAPYFSKIQCFCFEEQKLNAGETVDMPVFFFIDPDFLEDPQMKGIDTVTLSYTFFKSKSDENGVIRPLPPKPY